MADVALTGTQQSPRVVFVMINISGGEVTGENSKTGPAPASKASIEAMPRIKVKGSGSDCCICLEEFEVEKEATEMPCKHVFHSGCIEKWLKIHGSCPVCRFLMPEDEVDETGGDDGGRGRLEGGENRNGLSFLQSVLAFANLASFMCVMGSGRVFHQPSSVPVDDDTSSGQNTDDN